MSIEEEYKELKKEVGLLDTAMRKVLKNERDLKNKRLAYTALAFIRAHADTIMVELNFPKKEG
jgi:hypothetical protein